MSIVPKNVKDITGQRFGRLVVIEFVKTENKNAYWLFKCDCGIEKIGLGRSLRDKSVVSCGCYRKTVGFKATHKRSNTKEFRTWAGLKNRCNNPKDPAYINYGGRGIKVCDRWVDSFENFLDDMGQAPSKNHSIDRKDNDGNYCPENCRWATPIQQSNNRRSSLTYEYEGGMLTLREISSLTKTPLNLLQDRVQRLGWSVNDAINRPARSFARFEYNGLSLTIAEWSRKTGIDAKVLQYRLTHGWPIDKALNQQKWKNQFSNCLSQKP